MVYVITLERFIPRHTPATLMAVMIEWQRVLPSPYVASSHCCLYRTGDNSNVIFLYTVGCHIGIYLLPYSRCSNKYSMFSSLFRFSADVVCTFIVIKAESSA